MHRLTVINWTLLERNGDWDVNYHTKDFLWLEIGDFITDRRVMLVTGKDGQLFYERPRALSAAE